jgi:hypothetical protein
MQEGRGAMEQDPHRSPAGPDHPAEEELRRFMAGTSPPAATLRIVRHLLRGCPDCGTVTSGLWDLGAEGILPAPAEIPVAQREEAFHGRY